MTRGGRFILQVGILSLTLIAVWRIFLTQTPHQPPRNLSQILVAPKPESGIAWTQWQQTQASNKFAPALQVNIASVVSHWEKRGVDPDSFRVLHGISPARQLELSCYPFEKRHAHGDAIDVRPGDCNSDGKIDALDACLFAHSLDTISAKNLRGAIGVYGRQKASDSEWWVHIDNSGKTDRWGQIRTTQEKGAQVQPIVWSPHEREIAERAASWNLKLNRSSLKVVIRKVPSTWRFDAGTQSLSVHPTLAVYAGRWPLKYFAAALGYDPIRDKEKRDDYRTPEGDFYLCGFNAQSRYYKSLRLSYPNREDAVRGLRSGLIDRATHNAIVRAIARGRTPPQDTRLGGDIMIHGGGIGKNWAWGCVALENKAVDELFDLLPLRTRIKVL